MSRVCVFSFIQGEGVISTLEHARAVRDAGDVGRKPVVGTTLAIVGMVMGILRFALGVQAAADGIRMLVLV